MTQHHDPVHPGEPDEPVLGPDDDAFVQSLLADLPPVAMPADVVARIEAALAAEPDIHEAAAEASTDVPTAATTVVPLAGRRRTSTPRLLQVAAAVVLVVGGGAFAVKALGNSSTDSATAGSAAPASGGSAVPPLVTASGRDYSAGSLADSVIALADRMEVSNAPSPLASPKGAFTSDGSTTGTATAQLATDTAVLAQCVTAVQGNPVLPQPALSIDIGTFDKKPAVVIVVQSTDPKVLTTYVTTPACGTTAEPTILYLVNVRRP